VCILRHFILIFLKKLLRFFFKIRAASNSDSKFPSSKPWVLKRSLGAEEVLQIAPTMSNLGAEEVQKVFLSDRQKSWL
jgi:hypothetical protein